MRKMEILQVRREREREVVPEAREREADARRVRELQTPGDVCELNRVLELGQERGRQKTGWQYDVLLLNWVMNLL